MARGTSTASRADGTPCIWQDGLDIPLVNALEANFYAVHEDLRQEVRFPVNDSTSTWGNPGLRPSGGEWNRPYSPLLKYEWGPTYEALQRYARASDGSPFDGVLLNYVNPLTGGPVMQTIGASMQMLRPGEQTKAHRHTGASSTRSPRARVSPSSTANGSTGGNAIFSACPRGRGTNTPTLPIGKMPACSPSMTCR